MKINIENIRAKLSYKIISLSLSLSLFLFFLCFSFILNQTIKIIIIWNFFATSMFLKLIKNINLITFWYFCNQIKTT